MLLLLPNGFTVTPKGEVTMTVTLVPPSWDGVPVNPSPSWPQQQCVELCPTPVTPKILQFTTAVMMHPARDVKTTKAAITPPGAAPSAF